jgi:hypothetical protein
MTACRGYVRRALFDRYSLRHLVLRVFLMDLLARRQLCPIARFVSTGRVMTARPGGIVRRTASMSAAARGLAVYLAVVEGGAQSEKRRALAAGQLDGGGSARDGVSVGVGAKLQQFGRRRSAYPCRLPGAVRSPRAGGPGRGWPAAINSLPEDTVEEGAVEVHVARLEFRHARSGNGERTLGET